MQHQQDPVTMSGSARRQLIQTYTNIIAQKADLPALQEGVRSITFAQMEDQTRRFAAALGPGISTLAVHGIEGMDAAVLCLMALKQGITLLPLADNIPEKQCLTLLTTYQPDALVTPSRPAFTYERMIVLEELKSASPTPPPESLAVDWLVDYHRIYGDQRDALHFSWTTLSHWFGFLRRLKPNLEHLQFCGDERTVFTFPTWLLALLEGGRVSFSREPIHEEDYTTLSWTLDDLADRHEANPSGFFATTHLNNLITTGTRLFDPTCLKETLKASGTRWHNFPAFPEAWMVGTLIQEDGRIRHEGKPMLGAGIMVVNPAGEMVPPGVEGLLRLVGDVAPRWTDQQQNTSFDTGYRAKWLPNGRLALGPQGPTLLRGSRCHPRDLEWVLNKHEGVLDCSVAVHHDTTGNPIMRAYVVANENVTAADLNELARAWLPQGFFPIAFNFLPALPHDEAGKLDLQRVKNWHLLDSLGAQSLSTHLQEVEGIEDLALEVEEHIAEAGVVHINDYLPNLQTFSSETRLETTRPIDIETHPPAHLNGGPLEGPADIRLSDVLQRAAATGNGVGYVYHNGLEDFQTYGALQTEALRVTAGLYALGCKPGDKVMILLPDCRAFITCTWACFLGGLILVPMTVPQNFLEPSPASANVFTIWKLLDKPLVVMSEHHEAAALAGHYQAADFRSTTLEELGNHETAQIYHGDPDDDVLILFTSGSTGLPKGVVHKHRTLVAQNRGMGQVYGFNQDTVCLNWFALDHVGGLVMSHLSFVTCKGTQWQTQTQNILANPILWLDLVDRHRVNYTWAPNFAFGLINSLVDEMTEKTWDLSCLTRALSGGEAVNLQTCRAFLKQLAPYGLPHNAIIPAWGMSETSSATISSFTLSLEGEEGYLVLDRESLAHVARPIEPGPDAVTFIEVGKPHPGTEVRIVDRENRQLREAEVGRIQIRGLSVTPGYFNNPEENGESFTEDGWFTTGDLGLILNGNLAITGREKDVIIINGVNLNASEVESAVEMVSGIEVAHTAACAVTHPGDDTDRLAIFYVSKLKRLEDLLEQVGAIRHQISQQINVNPTYIVPVEKADIEKTSIGKIQRLKLRDRLIAGDFQDLLKKIDLSLRNENTLPKWFFTPQWRSLPAVGAAYHGPCIIFRDKMGLCEHLLPLLSRPMIVSFAHDFHRISDTHFEMDPDQPDHLDTLFDGLDPTYLETIIDLRCYDWDRLPIEKAEGLSIALNRYLYQPVKLIQALDRRKPSRCRLVFAGRGLYQCSNTDQPVPERALLHGLLKTAALESPWLSSRLVDLGSADLDTCAAHLCVEVNAGKSVFEIAYRDGVRLTRSLAEAEAPMPAQDLLRHDALYLVSGGLGGVGFEVSKMLMTRYKARILLIGRSEISAGAGTGAATRLKQLQHAGDCFYRAGDIADASFVAAAVDEAETSFKTPLYGVFHLAGAISHAGADHHFDEMNDRFLTNASKADFEAVIPAKVQGTLVLNRLLRQRPHTLFVGFSSVNSIFGSQTLGPYAAVGSFLDGYLAAQPLDRNHATVCINWSMWEGMGMSRAIPAPIRAASRAAGYEMITAEQGILSLMASLRMNAAHMVIGIDAGRPKIYRQLKNPVAPKQVIHIYYRGSGEEVSTRLRERTKAALATQGIPAGTAVRFFHLDEIPRHPDGRLNKEHPSLSALELGDAKVAEPTTETQIKMTAIWSEMLKVHHLGIDDDFFTLGGHSILATRLIARISASFEIDLPLQALYLSSDIRGLSETVDRLRSETGNPPITAVPREGRLPLSFAQERLWFLYQFEDTAVAYNMPIAFRLRGVLNIEVLQQSLELLLSRHEALRTTFDGGNGVPFQIIHKEHGPLLRFEDYAGRPDVSKLVSSALSREAQTPFDLQTGPLFRALLIRRANDDFALMLNMSHIISDGWSFDIIFQDIRTAYNHLVGGLPLEQEPLTLHYADFAVWQRTALEGEALEKSLAYWRGKLTGTEVLSLPSDLPRPSSQSYCGAQLTRTLTGNLGGAMQRIAASESTTLFVALMAAFKVLLHRYTGQTDITVGAPTAGRERAGLEKMVGFFVNSLALRDDLSGDPTYRDLLKEVHDTIQNGFAHQEVPFEKIVEALQPDRDMNHSPLFQVMFALQNVVDTDLQLTGLQSELIEIHSGTSKFDLTLAIQAQGASLYCVWEYNTDLFTETAMSKMLDHLERLLRNIATNPGMRISQYPLLTENEQARLLQWNQRERPYPGDTSLSRLFEKQVLRTPDAIAVQDQTGNLTYTKLNTMANALAGRLQTMGLQQDQPVAFCLDRSPAMIAVILGIIKAGGAYVPLDASYTEERLRFMLQDTRAPLFISEPGKPEISGSGVETILLEGPWQKQFPTQPANPTQAAISDQLAYIVYTSGSTGLPKGVLVTHRNVARLVFDTDYVKPQQGDGFAQVSNVSFDAFTFEIWTALLHGARLCLVPKERYLEAADFAAEIIDMRLHFMFMTAALFKQFATAQPQMFATMKGVLVGGEKVDPGPARAVIDTGFEHLINGYGPTESTTFAITHPIRNVGGRDIQIPVGRPIANTYISILDRSLYPIPVGAVGEIMIGGCGLARGYLNRSALSAERFVPDPRPQTAGARLYRTGDLGRYREDGLIECLGRVDRQIKLRGFRIEPGEIEHHLESLAEVRGAYVTTLTYGPGDIRLTAWIQCHGGNRPTVEEIKARLSRVLPGYMTPSGIGFVDSFPRTSNGKLDINALPKPENTGTRPYQAPETETERLLADIWQNVLGPVGHRPSSEPERFLDRLDHFFELGGHSLLATRVSSAIRETCRVELPLKKIFDHPVLGDLAAQIDELRAEGTTVGPIPIAPEADDYPLSFAQERLWFLDRLTPENAGYNMPLALHLTGPLDRNVLLRVLKEIAQRHQPLRIHFTETRKGPRCVLAKEAVVPFHVIDLSDDPNLLAAMLDEEAHRPFSLARSPLFRVTLYRLAEEAHMLLINLHHIISDGWSMQILFQELAHLYPAFHAGRPSPLPPLSIGYVDYAAHQRAWLTGEVLESRRAFWTGHLKGAPDHLELVTDFARPAVLGNQGEIRLFEITSQATHAFQSVCDATRVTPFMAGLSLFAVLLQRYSGTHDLCIGTPSANRGHQMIEELIGFFVNTLVMRIDLKGDPSFRELLARTRAVVLDAYNHQDMPFEQLVDELCPDRDMSRSPLFQVLFTMEDSGLASGALHQSLSKSLESSGLQVVPGDLDFHAAKYELTLGLSHKDGGLLGTLEYNTNLFENTTIEGMIQTFKHLFETMVGAPDLQLSQLSPRPLEQQLLNDWNQTVRPYPHSASLQQLFQERVALDPTAVAVQGPDQAISYDTLNRMANQLAHTLLHRGLKRDQPVAFCLDQSIPRIAVILGIIKAGGAYVPLDPTYNEERLLYMLKDTHAMFLITEPGMPHFPGMETLSLQQPWSTCFPASEENPTVNCDADQLAYIIYTSGSTGLPKGTLITHRNVTRLVFDTDYVSPQAGDGFAQVSNSSFDAFTFEMWTALLHGGRLCLVPRDRYLQADTFAEEIITQNIHFMFMTAALFKQFATANPTMFASMKGLLVGGEKVDPGPARAVLETGFKHLINGYGPTESTTFAITHPIREIPPDAARIPVGRPIANTTILVLDPQLQTLPLGALGEMFIGGDGLARGYLNRPGLTAEKFLPNPAGSGPGARLYRVGDLGRYRWDGTIDCLGRVDRQVKLRGFRIEPGEIEHHLEAIPQIRNAVVATRQYGPEDIRLLAWLQCHDVEPDIEEIKRRLTAHLPPYMTPTGYAFVTGFPRTANGKLDLDALPDPEQSTNYREPQTDAEKRLAAVWCDVLGLECVGAGDHFFMLGGNSLLVTRVITQIKEDLGLNIPVKTMFEAPILADMAGNIEIAMLSSATTDDLDGDLEEGEI